MSCIYSLGGGIFDIRNTIIASIPATRNITKPTKDSNIDAVKAPEIMSKIPARAS